MRKEEVLSLVKKMTAGVLAIGMILTGLVICPKQTEAAVEVPDAVIYEEGYDITEYWNDTNPKAPVKAGYVFGGWYSAKEENAYMTKETAATATTAYAKFVPAKVLSVKAQNKAGTGDTITNNTNVRVISSLDSKNYAKVGFDIWLANSVKLYKDNDAVNKLPLETDKIYGGLLVGENKEEKDAQEIFGGVSRYVSVWQLDNIASAHWNKIIYVRPYWITMDGTKVEGLAKYVHVEDDYMEYISVPVNLLNKEAVAKMAAGVIHVTCSNAEGKEIGLQFLGVEAGRLVPEMITNKSENGNQITIKMVGNAKEIGEYNSDETLYANIRFKKPENPAVDVDVDFSIELEEFCTWDEKIYEISEKWDVEYDAK